MSQRFTPRAAARGRRGSGLAIFGALFGSVGVVLVGAGCPGAAANDPPTEARPPAATPPTTPAKKPKHAEGERRVNHLVDEKSPYLLQHAHNPVDWYPWGPAAFAKAKKMGRPIFLSIGYSTCHWCHVMERESFEDETVAAFLNEHFVAIKVDREERPDIDAVYMAVTQRLTGSGGWPMSVFLTPKRHPFYAGTYFPPEDRYGRPGFLTLLKSIAKAWDEKRERVVASGKKITEMLQERVRSGPQTEATEAVLHRTVEELSSSFDAVNGGFGHQPKFPRTHDLSLLLRIRLRTGDARIERMVRQTLDHMARGGIHDHLGGGFHRYATDAVWLVPHFEKMAYDQALIAHTYLTAYQALKEPRYGAVARDVLDYVLRDMTSTDGAFFSAEDADSEGEEGKFYVWTRAEILTVLGAADGALFSDIYNVTDAGNFFDEATGKRTGANILHLEKPVAELAKDRSVELSALRTRLKPLRAKLLAVRSKRVRPLRDDKVLTDWNGLLIAAFARGARVLDEPRYLDAASGAARFLLARLRREDGRLLHRFRDGEAAIPAFLDDHAFLCWGLLELYEASFDARWLLEAKALAHELVRLFEDPKSGGFFLAGSDGEAMIVRTKELYDGARPSGFAAAVYVLQRLGRITQDEKLAASARRALRSASGSLRDQPRAHTFLQLALDEAIGPAREIVIAGDPADERTRALVRVVRERFLPRAVVLLHPPGKAGAAIEEVVPFVEAQGLVEGVPAAYVCEGYACEQPVTDAKALAALLDAGPGSQKAPAKTPHAPAKAKEPAPAAAGDGGK